LGMGRQPKVTFSTGAFPPPLLWQVSLSKL